MTKKSKNLYHTMHCYIVLYIVTNHIMMNEKEISMLSISAKVLSFNQIASVIGAKILRNPISHIMLNVYGHERRKYLRLIVMTQVKR